MNELLEKYGINEYAIDESEKWNRLCKSEVLTEEFLD